MTCDIVRPHLEAYVDRELPGAEMLRVSQHLDACSDCALEAESLAEVGDLLRGAVEREPAPSVPDGLAPGVIARVGAETALSWRATLARGVEDWHWALVGAGSVAATFVSAVIVAVVVMFGPNPERSDSLAALISNLHGSPGTLWIEGQRVGIDTRPVMLRVDSGLGSADAVSAVPASLQLSSDTEADLVLALLGVMDGRGLQAMSGSDRQYAEQLLDSISARRTPAVALGPAGQLIVYRLRLAASTGVTAKLLNP